MIDREKVIEGLECCASDTPFYHAPCGECPYNGRKPDNMGGCTKLYRDAIELLKEQPHWISVTERLPEEYETVLVAIAGHDVIIQKDGETLEEAINRTYREVRYVTTGSIDEDGDWNGPEGYPMMVQPSYWMSLPEPPTKNEEPHEDR